MIVRLRMEIQDKIGNYINYYFDTIDTHQPYAMATNNVREWVKLNYKGADYEYIAKPRMIERSDLHFRYPVVSKRASTPGFYIHKNGEVVGAWYAEAMVCRNEGFFKKKLLLDVFQLFNHSYMMFKVGFRKENSHYYCIYNDHNQLISIIERHNYYDDGYRATLYVEDDENMLLTLLAVTREMILIPGGPMEGTDTSAGLYVSRYEEEMELFNRDFINRVLAQY